MLEELISSVSLEKRSSDRERDESWENVENAKTTDNPIHRMAIGTSMRTRLVGLKNSTVIKQSAARIKKNEANARMVKRLVLVIPIC